MRRKKFCAGDFGNRAAHILTQPLAEKRVAFFILLYFNPRSGREENIMRNSNFISGFDVNDADNYGGLYSMYNEYSVSTGMVENGMVKKNDLMWSDEYVG